METEIRIHQGKSGLTKIGLIIFCLVFYGLLLFATSSLVIIPGVTWLRIANVFSEIFGVNFGLIGCLGVAFGNSFGDYLKNTFTLTTAWWVIPLEFVATAWIPYFFVTDPSLRSLRGKIEWVVFVVVGQGLVTGYGISAMICLLNLAPRTLFQTIGRAITLNEAGPAILAGFIQYGLFPQIVRSGWWMGRDLSRSNVPKEVLESTQN